jgi:tetratricopeptide (TPR) repeat protein
MIRRDQSSILAQRMTEVLPRIAELKQQERYKEAVDEINETVRTNLGLSPRFVKGVTDQDLLGMVRSGLLPVERAVALAKLLKERADINWAVGQPKNALIRTVKALTLFLEVFDKQQESTYAEYYSDVELLAANLGDYELPAATRQNLFLFYEAAGKYSKAEDLLFETLETAANGGWIETGRQFYPRLAAKSDSELEAGNLPREELQESRTELARFEPKA